MNRDRDKPLKPPAQERNRWPVGGVACVVVFVVSAVNYLIHVTGFSFFSLESVPIFSEFFYVHDVQRMAGSARYAGFGPAYAEYMIIIIFQFYISLFTISLVIGNKLMDLLFCQSPLETADTFIIVCLCVLFAVASFPWAYAPYGQESVFWNKNPRLGGQPIWLLTLLYSILWAFVCAGAIMALLEANLFNSSMRRYLKTRRGDDR